MTGRFAIHVVVSPATGSTATSFNVKWAAGNSNPYAYHVQVRHKPPNGTYGAWTDLFAQTHAIASAFTPDQGSGAYQFRSKLVNTNTHVTSLYSPPTTITVN